MSWLRADTTQILAAGSYTYVSDMRYTAAHSDTRDTWSLVIRNVTAADSGVFECQVSGVGKLRGKYYWLLSKIFVCR